MTRTSDSQKKKKKKKERKRMDFRFVLSDPACFGKLSHFD